MAIRQGGGTFNKNEHRRPRGRIRKSKKTGRSLPGYGLQYRLDWSEKVSSALTLRTRTCDFRDMGAEERTYVHYGRGEAKERNSGARGGGIFLLN